MTRLDRVILLAVLAAALVSWLVTTGSGRAADTADVVIEVAGQPVDRLSLAGGERREIAVQGVLGESVVVVEGNRARVLSAPCPDRVCVSTGWISRPGQAVVCVPNRLVLRIERPPGPGASTPGLGPGVDATTR